MERVVDQFQRHIDYRLRILGIRANEADCQLIAKDSKENWNTLGQKWELPLTFPSNSYEMSNQALDTLRLTAYQFDSENPGTDLRQVLGKEKDFELALAEFSSNLRTLTPVR